MLIRMPSVAWANQYRGADLLWVARLVLDLPPSISYFRRTSLLPTAASLVYLVLSALSIVDPQPARDSENEGERGTAPSGGCTIQIQGHLTLTSPNSVRYQLAPSLRRLPMSLMAWTGRLPPEGEKPWTRKVRVCERSKRRTRTNRGNRQ